MGLNGSKERIVYVTKQKVEKRLMLVITDGCGQTVYETDFDDVKSVSKIGAAGYTTMDNIQFKIEWKDPGRDSVTINGQYYNKRMITVPVKEEKQPTERTGLAQYQPPAYSVAPEPTAPGEA
jgi:hypothetical protein